MLNTPENQQPNLPTPSLSPIDKQNRIHSLDILRGVCLVGILLMNIEWFTRAMISLEFQDKSLTGLDHAVGWLVRCFVEGKFYKLFALLFGMGFAVMLLKAKEAGRPFTAWFSRRMIVLWLFGMAHMIFLWGGDILHSYALAGFILLFIVLKKTNHNPSSYLKLAIAWLFIPIFIVSLIGVIWGSVLDHNQAQTMWADDLDLHTAVIEGMSEQGDVYLDENKASNIQTPASDESRDIEELSESDFRALSIEDNIRERNEQSADISEEENAFTHGSYWEATLYRINFAGFMMMITPFLALFELIPVFLVGYWLVTSEKIIRSEQHHSFFKTLAYVGLLLGIPLNIISVLLVQHPAYEVSLDLVVIGDMVFYLAQFVLSAGYFGLVVCAIHHRKWSKVLSKFSPMGQMALTNYLMHSVILTSIFYGYAGGQYGEISRAPQMLIVLGIIAFQLVASSWWLSRFRFGPAEWLWRSLTYKKMQSMKL